MTKLEELESHLKHFAKEQVIGEKDDFSAYDYGGGNYDDTYVLGFRDGEISLARELLEKYFPKS